MTKANGPERMATPVGSRRDQSAGGLRRAAVLAAAGGATLFGLSRRSPAGAALAALGGAALYRAASMGAPGTLERAPIAEKPDLAPMPPRPTDLAVQKTVTIYVPRNRCYAFWHDFENLPRFMQHLESVRVLGGGRSHWATKAPLGKAEWDAEMTEDDPGRRIAWQSVPGSGQPNSGWVEFSDAPGGRGTEVQVFVEYKAPGGPLAAVVGKLFGQEPTQQVQDDLRRFKEIMEAGETATTEGQPSGRKAA